MGGGGTDGGLWLTEDAPGLYNACFVDALDGLNPSRWRGR